MHDRKVHTRSHQECGQATPPTRNHHPTTDKARQDDTSLHPTALRIASLALPRCPGRPTFGGHERLVTNGRLPSHRLHLPHHPHQTCHSLRPCNPSHHYLQTDHTHCWHSIDHHHLAFHQSSTIIVAFHTVSVTPTSYTTVRFHLVLVVLVVLALFGLAYSCSPLIPPPPTVLLHPSSPPLTLLSCSPSPRAPISTTGSNLGSWDDSHDNHISQLKLRDEHPGVADPHLRIHQQDPRHPHHRQVPSLLSCTHPVGPSTAGPQRRSPHLHSGTLAQTIVSPTPTHRTTRRGPHGLSGAVIRCQFICLPWLIRHLKHFPTTQLKPPFTKSHSLALPPLRKPLAMLVCYMLPLSTFSY